MPSTIVSKKRKKMAKLKTKILLEMINDIITEYPNSNDFIKQKLIEKSDREGTSIDEVIYFFSVSLEAKTFLLTNHVIYQSQDMLLAGLRMSFVLLKRGLVYAQ